MLNIIDVKLFVRAFSKSNEPRLSTIFYPTEAEYTFFSRVHRAFSRTDQVLVHTEQTLMNVRLKFYQVSDLTTIE